MPLTYKEDWEETKQRYQAWWNGEYFGRCGLWVTAPRNKPLDDSVPPQRPDDAVKVWTDPDYISAQNHYRFSHTFYGGDAFPVWSPGYAGVGSISSFMGAPLNLDDVTGWHNPVLTDDDWDVRKLKMDSQNQWWDYLSVYCIGVRQNQRANAFQASVHLAALVIRWHPCAELSSCFMMLQISLRRFMKLTTISWMSGFMFMTPFTILSETFPTADQPVGSNCGHRGSSIRRRMISPT